MKKLLICGIDVECFMDINGEAYTLVSTNNWWNRFKSIPNEVEIVILAVGIPIDVVKNNYIKISDLIPDSKVVYLPKAKTPIEYFSCMREIKRVVDTEMSKVDATIIRYQGHTVFLACKAARKYKVKQLVEIGNVQWDAFWNHGFYGKLLAPFMEKFCRKDIYYSDYVQYVTNKFLQKRYPTKGKSVGISNVELEEFDCLVLERRKKKIEGLNNKIVIGTAAAVNVRYKGQQYMIEALKILKEKGYDNFEYQIAGQGNSSYLQRIVDKCEVKSQVKFMGKLPHEQVFKWMDSLDIYIQPSLQEGLPRAMIEAMSRALPCIGARTAGIPELIDDQYIYNHRNMPKKISELILKLTQKSEMLNQSKKNYEHSQKYKYDNILKLRNKFYSEFLECEVVCK